MDTNTEQATALRILANELNRLADEVEAGNAKYLDGSFDYQINRDAEDVPQGAIVRQRALGSATAHLRADVRFRTGQKTLDFHAGKSPA